MAWVCLAPFCRNFALRDGVVTILDGIFGLLSKWIDAHARRLFPGQYFSDAP